MKILQLTAENIKKLSAIEITPDGHMVVISGKNGQGKSSVLDAIWWALCGSANIQAQPIRKGETKARVAVKLGDGEKAEMIVERRFTEKGSTLHITSADGSATFKSPQQMLDKLVGALAFDPLAFMSEKPKEQFEKLRKLVKLEVDFDALAAKREAIYQRRTGINRDVKSLALQADAIKIEDDWPDKEIDRAAIMDRLAGVDAHNAKIREEKLEVERAELNADNALEALASYKETMRNRADARLAEISDLEAQLANAKALHETESENERRTLASHDDQARALRAKANDLAAQIFPDLQDAAAIREELRLAELNNAHVETRRKKEAAIAERDAKQKEADAASAEIEAIDKQKAEAIAKAKMPVEGLGFGDDVVTFSGLPLDQASSAQQLMVSTSIAAEFNPELRVMQIRNGSLLDEDSMAWLAEFAQVHDFQIWIERVDSSGAVGIVMEDGHVRAAETTDEAVAPSSVEGPAAGTERSGVAMTGAVAEGAPAAASDDQPGLFGGAAE